MKKGKSKKTLNSLQKKLAHVEPLWCLINKEQKNTRIRYINKFYIDIKCKHCIIPISLLSPYPRISIKNHSTTKLKTLLMCRL